MNNSFTESSKALSKANDAIETAIHDLKGGYTLAAVNRSYYAMFYCMTALLTTQNIYTKTHNGLKTKFNEVFVKTGVMPLTISTFIQEAFDLRHQADYDLDIAVSEDESQTLIDNAKIFYNETKNYLSKFIDET